MSVISCEHLSRDAVEAFHPVVSRNTGFIYVNKLCARCNNVTVTVPWRRAVTSSPEAEVLLSQCIESFINGKNSVVNPGCHIYYVPPVGFDISPADSCNPFVIRTCNEIYFNSTSQYWKLCEKFNATFTARNANKERLYANVFCFLCNSEISKANRSEIRKKQCLKTGGLNDYKLHSDFKLTVILDMTSPDQNPVSKDDAQKSECPVNSVSVTPFTKECRLKRCPWGQFLLKNRCGYYSKIWVGGPFTTMLRLSPVKKNALIQSSFFENMPGIYKDDRHAFWINRRTLKRWNFLVLYHPYQDNPVVEYIVVTATLESKSVNPHQLKRMVKEALDDTWQIHYMNSSFDFSVAFNDYFRYEAIASKTIREVGINISAPFGFYPAWVFSKGGLTPDDNFYQEMLHPVTTVTKKQPLAVIPITKLFFCDQIDLVPEEYDYKYGHIFFRVKNISIHQFIVLKSIANGHSTNTPPTENYNISVRVCLHEFEQTYNTGSVKLIPYIVSFYISIHGKVFVV